MNGLPKTPQHFSSLKANLKQLISDFPNYESNVFIVMRFTQTQQIQNIASCLNASLLRHGLTPLRADQKKYHPELWGNICTYMLGASKGVIVFEDIDIREFNPNVALELGFLLALGKPCLILKEKRLPRPPTDVIGHLWHEFDAFDIESSIDREVTAWTSDIDWRTNAQSSIQPTRQFFLRIAHELQHQLIVLLQEFDWELERQKDDHGPFHAMARVAIAEHSEIRANKRYDVLARADSVVNGYHIGRKKIVGQFQAEVLRRLMEPVAANEAIEASRRALAIVVSNHGMILQDFEGQI